jgi:hypothetical protein
LPSSAGEEFRIVYAKNPQPSKNPSPGTYLGYNNSITYNWNAESDDRLTLPLGLMQVFPPPEDKCVDKTNAVFGVPYHAIAVSYG